MSRLRVAVVGVGSMGANHARVYSELDSVDLVGIADPDAAAAARVARRYQAAAFTSCSNLLQTARPDIVSVAVPTRLHEEVALDVIRSGCHVLVEKPLALSVESAVRIVEAAAGAGVKLAVGHVERFNPVVVEIKQRLCSGELGRIFQVHARRLSPFPGRIDDVGVILDLATHDIDIIRHLLRSDVQRVFAETGGRSDTPNEDLLTGLIRFENGVVALLDVNWLTPTKVRQLTVLGENGMYVADYLTQDLYRYLNTSTASTWESLNTFRGAWDGDMVKIGLQKKEPLRAELESFVGAVAEDREPEVPGSDGVAAIALSSMLIQAADSNMPVTADMLLHSTNGGAGGSSS